MLDITTRAVLVVGGGTVAARKVKGLLAAGAARITAVAPHFSDDMPATITRHVRSFQANDLANISLVFAATDSRETNDLIAAEARRRNVLFNRADTEEGDSDFATPAVLRRGPITITVSTGGSPALGARLRDHLDGTLDNAWPFAAEAMQSLRPAILACISDSRRRKHIFHELASDEALAAARRDGPEGLRRYAIARFPELRGG
jgi:precorrin-2 dehydrogenase / sirohydrochlorin ferrochelatase